MATKEATKQEEKSVDTSIKEVMPFPGSTTTVDELRRALADMDGNASICFRFPAGWYHDQAWMSDSAQHGKIEKVEQDHQHVYLTAGRVH